MKKALVITAALAAALIAGTAFAADGVVNVDAVLANYPAFTKAQQQMGKTIEQKQAAINAEKDNNKKQQLAQQAQQEIAQEQQKLVAPLLKNVNDAIAKVAKAKKLGMVHPAPTVLYGGVDITKDVIDALK